MASIPRDRRPPGKHNLLCDVLFLLFAAAYAFLAWEGILPLSGYGARIDSDLETYAQGMAGQARPELFSADPVLREATPANSIRNVQREIASRLAPPDSPAIGLLRAGALAIFVFYAGWYIFGRWFFRSPVLAAILALLSGITVWVGWGTFWGISHSDPIPRVFFGAIFPFLLLLALAAINRPALRPPAALACGLCMWVHGISALNCGAMFLMAFLAIKPPASSLKAHLANTFFCAAAFLLPLLYFLWPSLAQSHSFSQAEMDVFRQVFALRWREDYAGFWPRLLDFLNPAHPPILIILGGFCGWLLCLWRGGAREKILCAACPAFVLALAIMAFFCWAESHYAPDLGRLPMGHEIVRGLRFLVPLSWILIVAGGSHICGPIPRRIIFAALAACLALFTADRQYAAAQLALGQKLGIALPLRDAAEKEMAKAQKQRETLEAVEKTVPPGEAIFCDEDMLGARYLALRPLVHSFKDGYVFFYNKDLPGSENWLNYEKTMRQNPMGYIDAWLRSGAPWLLTRKSHDLPDLQKQGHLVLQKNDWLLLRKKNMD